MMKHSILWAAALLLAVSCGGGTTNYDGPYQAVDGIYTITVKGETIQLAEIPAGTFTMGETLDMGRYRTPAVHQVILDGFAIGTTEVSQALWKAVMGSNPSPKDVPNAPVTNVTYKDVQKFLKKLSKATFGLPFRLPTEAEWENAARQREGMTGGAWEWCSDRWNEDLGLLLTVNPQGNTEGALRALRGGSAFEKNNKAITRKPMAETSKAGDVGFRLAVSTGEAYPAEIYDNFVSNKVVREQVTDLNNETFTVGGVKFDMIAVEGGTFMMGGEEQKSQVIREDELPVHEVTLDSFKIGKLEVTQALWEAVMGYVPYGNQGPDYPIGNVSWYDVQAFIRQLNALTGRKFRLPTEAEWEYAARGGKKSRGNIFAGSNYPQGVAQYGYDDMRTRPVARYSPNELGLYDMSGNAWEWCQDRPGPYNSLAQVNPTGPEDTALGDIRIMRGGSVATTADKCRVSNRNEFHASQFRTTIGFRLAL